MLQNGHALRWASGELKADRELVLKAVSNNGWALTWASDELKGDEEICAQAAFGSLPEAVVLKVALLSGRYCVVP